MSVDYTPHYPQPFTLAEAVQMDVSVITEEIARLQNSLEHLRQTQTELKEYAEAAPDPEFTKAIEENETVIGSQEERISILKLALTERGIMMGSHYDPASVVSPVAPSNSETPSTRTPADLTSSRSSTAHEDLSDADDGIFI